jgi:hypothetical protein
VAIDGVNIKPLFNGRILGRCLESSGKQGFIEQYLEDAAMKFRYFINDTIFPEGQQFPALQVIMQSYVTEILLRILNKDDKLRQYMREIIKENNEISQYFTESGIKDDAQQIAALLSLCAIYHYIDNEIFNVHLHVPREKIPRKTKDSYTK